MSDEQLFNHAIYLHREGRRNEALETLLDLSRRNPDNGYIWGTLGMVWSSVGKIPQAVEAFEKAVRLDPTTEIWRQELGYILIQEGKFTEVEKYCNGSSFSSKLMRAKLWEVQGEDEQALEILEGVIDDPPSGVYDGRALPIEAHLAKAKCIYARCARRRGKSLDGLKMLARPNVIPSTPQHLVQDSLTDNLEVLYEKGYCYDALGEYDAAWSCFLAANQLQNSSFEPEVYKGRIRRGIESPRSHQGTRGGSNLIFIVGIPRSGTSLVEQILSRHPQVTPMGERTEIAFISHELDAKGWPDLEPSQIDDYADSYLENCPEGVMTDKMPDNWYNVGLIRQMFPEAKVVHCIRDPQDCLVSCFMQMFGHSGMGWSNSLEGLQTYFNLWKESEVGGLEVHYEELVSRPEEAIRALLEDLDLPYDERCLSPEGSGRHVATASYAQVKEPIHQRSIGRGAHYERHLKIVS